MQSAGHSQDGGLPGPKGNGPPEISAEQHQPSGRVGLQTFRVGRNRGRSSRQLWPETRVDHKAARPHSGSAGSPASQVAIEEGERQ